MNEQDKKLFKFLYKIHKSTKKVAEGLPKNNKCYIHSIKINDDYTIYACILNNKVIYID